MSGRGNLWCASSGTVTHQRWHGKAEQSSNGIGDWLLGGRKLNTSDAGWWGIGTQSGSVNSAGLQSGISFLQAWSTCCAPTREGNRFCRFSCTASATKKKKVLFLCWQWHTVSAPSWCMRPALSKMILHSFAEGVPGHLFEKGQSAGHHPCRHPNQLAIQCPLYLNSVHSCFICPSPGLLMLEFSITV